MVLAALFALRPRRGRVQRLPGRALGSVHAVRHVVDEEKVGGRDAEAARGLRKIADRVSSAAPAPRNTPSSKMPKKSCSRSRGDRVHGAGMFRQVKRRWPARFKRRISANRVVMRLQVRGDRVDHGATPPGDPGAPRDAAASAPGLMRPRSKSAQSPPGRNPEQPVHQRGWRLVGRPPRQRLAAAGPAGSSGRRRRRSRRRCSSSCGHAATTDTPCWPSARRPASPGASIRLRSADDEHRPELVSGKLYRGCCPGRRLWRPSRRAPGAPPGPDLPPGSHRDLTGPAASARARVMRALRTLPSASASLGKSSARP